MLNVIEKNTFTASIDLKDLFYSVPVQLVATYHQKYQYFLQMSIFTFMRNGYGHITKKPFPVCRMQGHTYHKFWRHDFEIDRREKNKKIMTLYQNFEISKAAVRYVSHVIGSILWVSSYATRAITSIY